MTPTFLCACAAAAVLSLSMPALAQTPAKSRARFGVVYVPMGAVMNNWTPAETGAGFTFSPILEPIGQFRDRMLVLTNLDNEPRSLLVTEGGNHKAFIVTFFGVTLAEWACVKTEGVLAWEI